MSHLEGVSSNDEKRVRGVSGALSNKNLTFYTRAKDPTGALYRKKSSAQILHNTFKSPNLQLENTFECRIFLSYVVVVVVVMMG